ncbi:MAG TPA: hypothetical protein VHB70_17435 [Parafilimonas sp.]|nr:hypothetical protein [Parafilimonas sp.]
MAKKTRKVIEANIEEALEGFDKKITDKKFKKHLKKASKILKDGLELPKSSKTKKKQRTDKFN